MPRSLAVEWLEVVFAWRSSRVYAVLPVIDAVLSHKYRGESSYSSQNGLLEWCPVQKTPIEKLAPAKLSDHVIDDATQWSR